MDLAGIWRAAVATESRRRSFAEPDHDDSGWFDLAVPGHWGDRAELPAANSVLYRRQFSGPSLDDSSPDPTSLDAAGMASRNPASSDIAGSQPEQAAQPEPAAQPEQAAQPRRCWLRTEGIAQQGDIWLDGVYLGATEGYFVPHQFEVTSQISARSDHVIAVEASWRRNDDPDNRSTLTGALDDPELCGAQSRLPRGLWRPLTIRTTGPVAIKHSRAVCTQANPNKARLTLRVVLDVIDRCTVELRTRIAGTEHLYSHPAAVGENRLEWNVEVDNPDLWWPHSLGSQPCYELDIAAMVDGLVNDARSLRIGLRTVTMRNWITRVNGERLFLAGANLLPARPGAAGVAETIADVRAARNAGLDLIRPVAHIARPELYETADRLGMLIWQDMPIRGVMSHKVAAQARRQTREAVDLLGHHPSLALWCAHDEPFARPLRPVPAPPPIGRQRPSWNQSVLDPSLSRVFKRCDGSRPVVTHTAMPPRLGSLGGSTSNLWFGWHGGQAADLAPALARVPQRGRFVSAFGAASVNPPIPPIASTQTDWAGAWPEIDWDHLGWLCAADPGALRCFVEVDACGDAGQWAAATRSAQAELVKTTIETLRRLAYRPTGGFLLHALSDPAPEGGFGVLDQQRRPKPAWAALVQACRRLIVVADPLPTEVLAGDRIDLAVHVVSALRQRISQAAVRAVVRGPQGLRVQRRWSGPISGDACSFVGRISADVPDGPGNLEVELSLATSADSSIPAGAGADGPVTNRYHCSIA